VLAPDVLQNLIPNLVEGFRCHRVFPTSPLLDRAGLYRVADPEPITATNRGQARTIQGQRTQGGDYA
jgi:hypothetical protein